MDTLREAHFPQEEDSARGLFAYSFKKESRRYVLEYILLYIYARHYRHPR
jgi:hypothetical protein